MSVSGLSGAEDRWAQAAGSAEAASPAEGAAAPQRAPAAPVGRSTAAPAAAATAAPPVPAAVAKAEEAVRARAEGVFASQVSELSGKPAADVRARYDAELARNPAGGRAAAARATLAAFPRAPGRGDDDRYSLLVTGGGRLVPFPERRALARDLLAYMGKDKAAAVREMVIANDSFHERYVSAGPNTIRPEPDPRYDQARKAFDAVIARSGSVADGVRAIARVYGGDRVLTSFAANASPDELWTLEPAERAAVMAAVEEAKADGRLASALGQLRDAPADALQAVDGLVLEPFREDIPEARRASVAKDFLAQRGETPPSFARKALAAAGEPAARAFDAAQAAGKPLADSIAAGLGAASGPGLAEAALRIRRSGVLSGADAERVLFPAEARSGAFREWLLGRDEDILRPAISGEPARQAVARAVDAEAARPGADRASVTAAALAAIPPGKMKQREGRALVDLLGSLTRDVAPARRAAVVDACLAAAGFTREKAIDRALRASIESGDGAAFYAGFHAARARGAPIADALAAGARGGPLHRLSADPILRSGLLSDAEARALGG